MQVATQIPHDAGWAAVLPVGDRIVQRICLCTTVQEDCSFVNYKKGVLTFLFELCSCNSDDETDTLQFAATVLTLSFSLFQVCTVLESAPP